MKSKRNDITNVYSFDFETRNSVKDIESQTTSIWLWDICHLTNLDHLTGYDIDSFIEQLEDLAPATFYTHNLKFDGSFIIYWLIKHKYKYDPDGSNMTPKTFNCLISGDNDIFYIRICFKNKKGIKAKQQIELRDSSKKIKGKVKQIAIDYHLPIKKGEIDMNKNRPEGYIATNEEIEYIKNDSEIIARVLNMFYEKNMVSLTASSDAFKMFKKDCGKWYSYFFPVLPIEIDDYIRSALKGGLCYVNPKHKGRTLNDVTILDANSFYPYIAANLALPYGKPEYFVGTPQKKDNKPLYIAHVRICCRLKENHIPTLQLKKFFLHARNEFVIDTQGDFVEMYLTNIDIASAYASYDIFDIEYIDGLYFCASKRIFTRYINELYRIKDQSVGAQRETNKILLNGLIGKFATKTEYKNKMPVIFKGDKANELDDVLYFEDIGTYQRDPIYTAVTVFVNSWGRYILSTMINDNFNFFVYCDTDSLHLIGDRNYLCDYRDINVDAHKLGYFKNEYEKNPVVNAKYLSEKTYFLLLESGDAVVKCSGAPDELKKMMTFENFKYNAVFNDRLIPKYVKGGCILVKSKFSIKDK